MSTPQPNFEISIIHKINKFYLFLYILTKSFPKKDRFALGLKCENITLEILELLYLANSKPAKSRLLILEKIDVKLKFLQSLIRTCMEARIINIRKYTLLEEKLLEIGRMLGGWIKYTKENPAK